MKTTYQNNLYYKRKQVEITSQIWTYQLNHMKKTQNSETRVAYMYIKL